MGRERGAAVSAEVQRLLQDALEGEDERLLALERRLGQLQAERARGAAPGPAPEPAPEAPSPRVEPAAAPPLELAEARRLVDESGRYLRELERSIEVLEQEGDDEPEPPSPSPAPPPPPPRGRGASGSQGRPADPGRHELGRVFAPGGGGSAPEGEPAWARALVTAQERTLAALERLEQTLQAGQERLEASVAAARVVPTPAAALPPVAEATPSRELPLPARSVGPRPSEALRARLREAPPEGVAPVRGALAETVRGAASPVTSARQVRAEHGPRRAALLELAGEQQALLATQVRLLERLIALVEG